MIHSSLGCVWKPCVSGLPDSAPVHCDQNEVVTKDNQISTSPAWTEEGLQDGKPCGIYVIELMKLIEKVNKNHINWKVFNLTANSVESFFIPVSDFIVFQPRIQTHFHSPE